MNHLIYFQLIYLHFKQIYMTVNASLIGLLCYLVIYHLLTNTFDRLTYSMHNNMQLL